MDEVTKPGGPAPRYQVVGEIGRGAMGVVYRALDSKLGRTVAVKVLPQELAGKQDLLRRFLREAKTLASLNHPNIATIHDLAGGGHARFLVLEYVEGETLFQRLARGPLPQGETFAVAAQIAAALEAAHARSIVHRDLKPANVKLLEDGRVKVLDFGLAKRLVSGASSAEHRAVSVTALPSLPDASDERSPELTQSGMIMGTPGFMSPEQVRDEDVGPKADVFAFGCLLFAMLTGQRAFGGDSPRDRLVATLCQHPDWSALPAETPRRVVELIQLCLAKTPAERLSDMGVARRVLERSLAATSHPAAGRRARRHNLPRQLSSFVGRETEIGAIVRLLAESPLLTLTGMGGCGKTRLALRAASELVEKFEHGVWLVELASVTDPELVPRAVASVFGLREVAGRSIMQTLGGYLETKSMLLVLDNCEHLLAACAGTAEALLQACPRLRIVASSREALGITGERTYTVASLSLPEPKQATGSARLADCEAVRLFMERASAARPDFELTEANAPFVAQVCRRLDGIPLALELAAARLRVLSIEQVASRLDDAFQLLTGGSKSALPRQQTMRATIDWSHTLLSDGERALLRRLSVFAGGWSLEAAERVCAGDGVEAGEILDLTMRLVDRSLVSMDSACGAARYRLLETVRQYAIERLVESGEAVALRRRHRDEFLELAERAALEVEGADQADWLGRLETEHDNLRAALEWCEADSEAALSGLRLATALARFWETRGHLREGRERLETALQRSGDATPELRAAALNWVGVLCTHQGELSTAHQLLGESSRLFRSAGDERGVARALSNMANAAVRQGDPDRASSLYEESLESFRSLGDKHGVVHALNGLAKMAHDRSDPDRAQALTEEALKLSRKLGRRRSIANLLNNLGSLSRQRGDLDRAQALYDESLALHRELGNEQAIAALLNNLGEVAAARGHSAAALELFQRSLALNRELGQRPFQAINLCNLGRLAVAEGDHEEAVSWLREGLRAARDIGARQILAKALEALAAATTAGGEWRCGVEMFAAAGVLRGSIGAPLSAEEQAVHESQTRRAREALGEEAFDRAWRAGHALGPEPAVEVALAEIAGAAR